MTIRFDSITHLLLFNLHMILISFFFLHYVCSRVFFTSSSFSPSIWPAIIICKHTHADFSLRFHSDCQPLATSIASNVIWAIVCMSMPFVYSDLEFFFWGIIYILIYRIFEALCNGPWDKSAIICLWILWKIRECMNVLVSKFDLDGSWLTFFIQQRSQRCQSPCVSVRISMRLCTDNRWTL